MKKEISSKSEFDELCEKINECLSWYDKRNFDEKIYKIFLANGEVIEVVFPKKTIAHLFGIKTEYLKSTSLLNGKNSYEILKEVCNDPYKIYKMILGGHLKYNSFISPYAQDKTDNFINNCGINDINSIEFVCPYIKEYSFITGKQQLEGDYYICYRKSNGLLILGLKKEGRYYHPMTNYFFDFEDDNFKEFLGQLLTNQHITMVSSIMLNNGSSDSKKIFYDNEEKLKKVKTLRTYSEEFDARVEIDRDFVFILEKLCKLYDLNRNLDNILTYVTNAMKNKSVVNLTELLNKGVSLPDSVVNMIKEYNLSLGNDAPVSVTNTYAKKTKMERDKLRMEFMELQEKYNELVRSSEQINQENSELKKENQRLQQENASYNARENEIRKILTKKK